MKPFKTPHVAQFMEAIGLIFAVAAIVCLVIAAVGLFVTFKESALTGGLWGLGLVPTGIIAGIVAGFFCSAASVVHNTAETSHYSRESAEAAQIFSTQLGHVRLELQYLRTELAQSAQPEFLQESRQHPA